MAQYGIREYLAKSMLARHWDRYLPALEKAGYAGFLTIEREVGDDPAADIAMAIDFLRGKI